MLIINVADSITHDLIKLINLQKMFLDSRIESELVLICFFKNMAKAFLFVFIF